MKKITIAIDGYSSTGKSTIAKKIAKKFDYIHVNSGSMYRAVTYFILKNELQNLVESDVNGLIKKLQNNPIEFKFDNNSNIYEIYLNKINIEKKLNDLKVSDYVSKVAAIPEIRKELVKIQREIDRSNGVVMDGRDIGSIVFPDAELKLFLTASDEVRAKRRYSEMINAGVNVNYSDVLENLKKRDKLDSTREDSPLIIVKDAVLIDNSNLTIDEQIKYISKLIRSKQNI